MLIAGRELEALATNAMKSISTLFKRALLTTVACGVSQTQAELLDVEKPDLIFGFIKLTDCAPLVIAKEKLFFEDEGLDVRLEAQANWKILLDRVISGELDVAL